MMISEKDLVGQLTNMPIEIVERMLFHQQQQGNKLDVNVFKNKKDAPRNAGGFDWVDTAGFGEGTKFWAKVIISRNTDVFFERYPKVKSNLFDSYYGKRTSRDEEKYSFGDVVIVTNAVEFGTKERVYVCTMPDTQLPYLTVTKDAFEELKQGKSVRITPNIRIKATPKMVELTLKDISEGKGVGIAPELIKIVK